MQNIFGVWDEGKYIDEGKMHCQVNVGEMGSGTAGELEREELEGEGMEADELKQMKYVIEE